MQRTLIVAAAAAVLLAGCAAKRPALYPNAALRAQGPAAGERAINECMQLARSYGHGSNAAARTAGSTAVGAAAGAAVGAAVGAVSGSAGRGAAVGAAGGGSSGLIGGLFTSGDPTPVERQFVDQCLRERGFQPIGWE